MTWTFPPTQVDADTLSALDQLGEAQTGAGADASKAALSEFRKHAKALVKSGAFGAGPWVISGAGHANDAPGEPEAGFAQDGITLNVYAVAPPAEPAGEVVLDADDDAKAAGHVVGEAPPASYLETGGEDDPAHALKSQKTPE